METSGIILGPAPEENEAIWAGIVAALPWIVQPGGARLRIIEVAGNGFFVEKFAAAGHTALLLNTDPEVIDAARDRLLAMGNTIIGTVALVRAPIADMSRRWPAASFDIVLCHQVFDRSFDPKLVLDTLTGAVRGGGHLSLAFQDRASAPLEALRQGDTTGARALVRGEVSPPPGLAPDDVAGWLTEAHFLTLVHQGIGPATPDGPASDGLDADVKQALASGIEQPVHRLRHIIGRRPAVFPIPL